MKSYHTYQETPVQQLSHSTVYTTHNDSEFDAVRDHRTMLYEEPAPPYPGYDDQFQPSPQRNRYENSQFPESNHFHRQDMLYGQQNSTGPGSMSLQPVLRHRGPSSLPSSSYSQASAANTPTDENFLSEALAFTQYFDSTPSKFSRLRNPIAIPQISAGMGQSFLRAWVPILQNYNITIREFVAFIDNLNVISTASPPLQVVDLAGGMIGMVPHHWAAIAGAAIQGTAKLGTYAVSKGRTEAYMREVNEKMFKPRGLNVRIASTEAARALLKIPNAYPTLAPLTRQTMNMSTAERVLVETRPYNAVLDLNVPPPTEQTTTLAKLSARQVAARSKKQQEKLVKSRGKDIEKQQGRTEKEREKQAKEDRKRERKAEKKAKKRERKHGKGSDSDSDSDTDDEPRRRSEKKARHEKRDKEEKQAEKLLWIVIDNL
jgi:hypothetical protein